METPSQPCAQSLAMKSVGKPDAGNPHVRFDERGRETKPRHTAEATAPFLDSTVILALDIKREFCLSQNSRFRNLSVSRSALSVDSYRLRTMWVA